MQENAEENGVATRSESNISAIDGNSKLKRIYSWASKNTSETRQLDDFKYYWSDAITNLLHILELSEGSIIALVGLSGVGKSSAQIQVAKALNAELSKETSQDRVVLKVVHFKWPGYLESNYERILQLLKMQNVTASDQEIIKIIADRLATSRNSRVTRRRLMEVFGGRLTENDLLKDTFQRSDIEKLLAKGIAKEPPIQARDVAEKLLGPSDMKSLSKELAISLLSQCHTIMIDLRDYGLRDSRAMNTDLSDIQRLWQFMNEHLYQIKRRRTPNIVIVLQKELLMSEEQTSVVSYFLRKASQTVELLPLTPAQMIQVYRGEFGDLYPFEPDALALLARYSRGIFRRFLKYIQLCLGWKLSHGDELITRKVVGEVVTEEEITADWEMEMHQIFPHGGNWNYAAKVMNILCTLSEKEIYPTLTQLAKGVEFVSRSDLSRIITKLEERGYIRRNKTPAGKVISVNW
ncbi:MAG TPA: hypothetical protein VNE86_08165 [Nitrososphaerales archaeon]|nr:hypothetical protein [Nitrososphaerales archaeon]